MSQEFPREVRHVAHLAYDFGRRWQQSQRTPDLLSFHFRDEIESLYQVLEHVPPVSSPRYQEVLNPLRIVRDLILRVRDYYLENAPPLGPEFCSAGIALDEAVKKTTPEPPEPDLDGPSSQKGRDHARRGRTCRLTGRSFR
jgi:hypothetical protein